MLKQTHNQTLLVVAAHPDDEVLGCAGTVARAVKSGWSVFNIILGEGATSRVSKTSQDDSQDVANQLAHLKQSARSASQILGVKDVFFCDFPDNRFDTVPLLMIIQQLEAVIQKINPQMIFTHSIHDLNIDHQRTHQAVLTATRPLVGQGVSEIYAFETLSATEWNYPVQFSPDTFVDIEKTLDLKLSALSAYASEMRDFPHPRSLLGIQKNAELWGMKTGMCAVEAFETIRRCI